MAQVTGPELQAALRGAKVGPRGMVDRIDISVSDRGILVEAVDRQGFTVRSATSGDAKDLARLVEEVTT